MDPSATSPPPAEPALPDVVAVAQTTERPRLDRWTLALTALGIVHQVLPHPGGVGALVVVRAEDADRARSLLQDEEAEQKERERAARAARAPVRIPPWATWVAQLMALALVGVSLWAGLRDSQGPRVMAGVMDSELVRDGHWERLFTGVTLHADGPHLLNNLLFLAVVAPTVVFRVGPGAAVVAFLLTGAAGNLASVLWHGDNFSNVGASGGVFGLMCMLGVLAARTRQSRIGQNRWLLGVGAVLGMLALFGFSEKADVVAHVGGFAAGAPLALWLPVRDTTPSWRGWWWPTQVAWGAAGVGVGTWAWLRALGLG
jgi:membrane associated rhomboid family serine protease